jgi:y4mF family transcriptional regulator
MEKIIEIKYPYRVRLPKYLGNAIRQARKNKQMTQQGLADITGTSAKFISDVERGKATVQMDKVFDLLLALNIQMYLIDKPLTLQE